MIRPIWEGITSGEDLVGDGADHHTLADRARSYDWDGALAILARRPELINTTRPDGSSRYTALHQAAHGGAPSAVVEQLLALGAWRTLRDAHGERPLDIAARRGYTHLVPFLTPQLHTTIPEQTLRALQHHCHTLINTKANAVVEKHTLRLPDIEVLQELNPPQIWFPIPGMYGGFAIRLESLDREPVLIVGSGSRVIGGSEQLHIVSPHGILLTAEGDEDGY